MRTKRSIGIASLLLLGLLSSWWWGFEVGGEPSASESTAAAATAAATRSAPLSLSAVRPEPVETSLTGRVTTPSGEPVAGARVCATCASCPPLWTDAHACVESDDQGRYAFPGLPSTGYKVVASAPGYAHGLANEGRAVFGGEERAGADEGDVALEEDGVELSGLVVDALGGAVAGARVRALPLDGSSSPIEAVTGDDGGFSFWIARGDTSLIASAAGYSSTRRVHVAPSAGIELVLSPGSVLSGTVVSAADDSPVAGAEVRALLSSQVSRRSRPPVLSAADGTFSLSGLEPGQYVVEASGPAFRGSSRSVAVGLAEQVSGVVVAVSGAVEVRGLVLIGSREQPCPEGQVVLAPEMRMEPATGASTATLLHAEIGPQGAVRFEGVPAGAYRVDVRCRDHVLHEGPAVLTVASEPMVGLRWQVETGLGLSISVVDANDAPVPRAHVMMIKPSNRPGFPPVRIPVITDAQGRHETPSSLRPGSYTLAPAPGTQGETVQLELGQGMGRKAVVLRLAGTGGLELQVSSADGTPVDGLQARALPQDVEGASAQAAVAMGSGVYRIEPLEAGTYRVEVSDGVNPPVVAEVEGAPFIAVGPGERTSASVVLERSAQITGRVVGAQGEPVADVFVSVESSATDARSRLQTLMRRRSGGSRTITDAAGAFTVGDLAPAGVFTVRAEKPGAALAVAEQVSAGGQVELVLEGLGSISGRAVGADGEPVSLLMLSALAVATGERVQGRSSDPQGRFALDGLPPGLVELTASDPRGQVAHERIELGAGQSVEGLELALRPRRPRDDGPP